MMIEYSQGGRVTLNGRPLVVLDPESEDDIERLAVAILAQPVRYTDDEGPPLRQTVANALRALVTPPKPDEPQGLGAVVEDGKLRRWVRMGVSGWVLPGLPPITPRYWSDFDHTVRVLSEGVQ